MRLSADVEGDNPGARAERGRSSCTSIFRSLRTRDTLTSWSKVIDLSLIRIFFTDNSVHYSLDRRERGQSQA